MSEASAQGAAGAEGAAEAASPAAGTNQRRPRNYFLQPFLQVRLGLYNILLAVAFGAAILGLLRAYMLKLEFWMRELAQAPPAVLDLGETYLRESAVFFVAVTAIFVVASILVSVIFTHRLVGPTVAFRRHVERLAAGDYGARTTLRRHDAFKEVAEELNRLSEALQRRDQAEEEAGGRKEGL